MELTTTVEGTSATVALDGKLTVSSAPALEVELKSIPEGVNNISLDLSSLDYVASAGLRVIVSASKRYCSAGGSFKLVHPNEEVMEVLDATGLVEILNIEA